MTMQTPSQILASKAIERLISENLISAESAKHLLPKLANGRLQSEDWRLPFELNLQQESNHEQQ